MRAASVRLHRAVSGVTGREFFAAQRHQILEDLRLHRNDRSLAGCIDAQMVDLVTFINATFPQLVTTSSCSGRLSLFHRAQAEVGVAEAERPRKRGGLGRGALFTSHDALTSVDECVRRNLCPALRAFCDWRAVADGIISATELLQLRFEPMILHLLCADEEVAGRVLQCASEAGQGESGIIACSRGTEAHRKIVCCVTSPLAFDIPLFAQSHWIVGNTAFDSDAWQHLLRHAVLQANLLFAENQERRVRFGQQLKARLQPRHSSVCATPGEAGPAEGERREAKAAREE